MKLHDLKPAPGSKRPKRRVGRGIGGKGGKTAGRGTKGQHARGSVKPGFEGGQMPLSRRVPKLKGFRNPFRVEFAVVNLDTLEQFEGGQTPLHRRTPKAKGFNNPFRIEYHVVNLSTLDDFDAGAEVSPDTLRGHGLVAKTGLVKILARGELTKSLTVKAHGFSAAAKQAIEAAGGTTEVLPLPWKTGRPPARGNAHTNR